MADPRESSADPSEWAGISDSGDDDMHFEVCLMAVNVLVFGNIANHACLI
jgi:hypothetical protein